MKKNHLVTWTVIIVLLSALPPAHGLQSLRVIPNPESRIVMDGQEFQSEMPLTEGASMVCHGNCTIQGPNFQLVAHDNAEFSLIQDEKGWTLTVKSGRMDFALQEDAKLTFIGPDGTYSTEKVIPASAGALVKGSITVTAQVTKFAVTAGQLQLAGASGPMLLQPTAALGGTAATATAIGLPVALGAAIGGTATASKSEKSPR